MVLWVVGTVAPKEIGGRRTSAYTFEDFLLLNRFLQKFDGITTTPHVATEVSNLIGSLSGQRLQDARRFLGSQLEVWFEDYLTSREISRTPGFLRFGLTDAAIRKAATAVDAVLTDDLPLYAWLLNEGVHAINFTHLRTENWGLA